MELHILDIKISLKVLRSYRNVWDLLGKQHLSVQHEHSVSFSAFPLFITCWIFGFGFFFSSLQLCTVCEG